MYRMAEEFRTSTGNNPKAVEANSANANQGQPQTPAIQDELILAACAALSSMKETI